MFTVWTVVLCSLFFAALFGNEELVRHLAFLMIVQSMMDTIGFWIQLSICFAILVFIPIAVTMVLWVRLYIYLINLQFVYFIYVNVCLFLCCSSMWMILRYTRSLSIPLRYGCICNTINAGIKAFVCVYLTFFSVNLLFIVYLTHM